MFLSVSAFGGQITLKHDGLVISAEHESIAVKKSNGKYILYGKVDIKNNSKSSKSYGNTNLALVIDNLSSRTYMDSIASQTIDFSSIPIQPGEEKRIKVYWVFNRPISTKDKTVTLKWLH